MLAGLRRVLVCAALASACVDRNPPLVFGPVAAQAVAELEREIATPPAPPAADEELAQKIRTRVDSIALDASPMHALATHGVSDFGDAAVPILSVVIGDATASVAQRTTAAEMLAALDSPSAAAALVHHACDNPVAWIRRQCAFQLGKTSQQQVMLPLLFAITSEIDDETRSWMGNTLAIHGCDAYDTKALALARRSQPADPENDSARVGPSLRLKLAVWSCIAQLADDRDEAARAQRISVLGRLPAFAAKSCIEALRDEHVRVRTGVAQALTLMDWKAGIAGDALLESLERDPALELEAVEALGAVRHKPASPAIERRLADATRPADLRIAAARALATLGAPSAVPTLVEALRPNEPVALRVAAAASLMEYGRVREAVPVLLTGLESTDAKAAESALEKWLVSKVDSGDARARTILEARRLRPSDLAAYAASIREALAELSR